MKHYLLTKRCKETNHQVYVYEELDDKEFKKKIHEGWRRL